MRHWVLWLCLFLLILMFCSYTCKIYEYIKPLKVYSAFHPSGVGKWVPAAAGKAKADMARSDCGWTCGCAGKTVKSLENTCHTWALLRWWFTTKRRYIKCMHLYLTFTSFKSKMLATTNISRTRVRVTKILAIGKADGVVDRVKFSSHLVWSPYKIWLLFLILKFFEGAGAGRRNGDMADPLETRPPHTCYHADLDRSRSNRKRRVVAKCFWGRYWVPPL